MLNVLKKFGLRIKEFFRKFMVSLKRKPQNIALWFFLFGFLVFSLNLTTISNTTAMILKRNLGFYSFAIFLLSILAMVCFLNSFPRRAKVKIPFIVLLVLMTVIIIVFDSQYLRWINFKLTSEPNAIIDYPYIGEAKGIFIAHIVIEIISLIILALTPVLKQLFKKINTSIAVDFGSESMHAIEIEND